ncbi:hypothetical protein H2203_000706 [Taxawa tesnikishii (nom. ined.)]|nr:hypothetical protein H2203_000706 [Dothideales sp. JES 119]
MRFQAIIKAAVLLAPTGWAAPQATSSLANIPECAQKPLLDGINGSDCSIANINCICNNASLLQQLANDIRDAQWLMVYDLAVSSVATEFCPGSGIMSSQMSDASAVSSSAAAAAAASDASTAVDASTTTDAAAASSTTAPGTTAASMTTSNSTLPIVTAGLVVNTSATGSILTDSVSLATVTPASLTGTTTAANYPGTLTYSTSAAATSSMEASTGGAASSDAVGGSFAAAAVAMLAMGLIFAEL